MSKVFIFGAAEFKERCFHRVTNNQYVNIKTTSWDVQLLLQEVTYYSLLGAADDVIYLVIAFSYFGETKSFSCSRLNAIMILPLPPTPNERKQ